MKAEIISTTHEPTDDALLRAHGLIHRVAGTHRYVVSEKGRRLITELPATRQAEVQQLTSLAA